MPSPPIFFLTACEASGDALGASLIKGLRSLCPEAQFIGVAGPLMRAAGCAVIEAQESLAVMGFVAVLKQLPRLLKARKRVARSALALRPTAYIGIDAPDFNLSIEAQLKSKGIKTVHVNSPTVWAWRSGRIHKIKKAVDLMLTLFPFETAIYEQHQIPACFIGHPLAAEINRIPQKALVREQLGLDETCLYLTLMPGSRTADVKYLAPVFLEAAMRCISAIPNLGILAPMIDERRAAQFQAVVNQTPGASSLPIQQSIGNAHQILQASDVVLIKSGTATLEAMLCKTNMVVAYKMDALSFWIAKKLVKVPYVSLPNLLANKALVPEFLQKAATPEKLAEACLYLLRAESSAALLSDFDALHRSLEQNTTHSAAEAIFALVQRP